MGCGEPGFQTQAPRLRGSALPPARNGATRRTPRRGPRGESRTPLTWSSRNSNRWALKLSTWKWQFCIKPSKLPSSTSTRSPSSRPWPSRSQLRALRTTEGMGAGRSPNPRGTQGGDGRQLRGAPSSSRRRRGRGALRSGPSGRGAGAHARGAAARRARGSGAPRRTQLGRQAPVWLQGAGRGAAGRARGRDTKAERRLALAADAALRAGRLAL